MDCVSVAVQTDLVPKLQDGHKKEKTSLDEGHSRTREEVGEEKKEEQLQRRVEVAIAAAHQLWKKQNEDKLRAALCQARKEWAEQHRTERDVSCPCSLIG